MPLDGGFQRNYCGLEHVARCSGWRAAPSPKVDEGSRWSCVGSAVDSAMEREVGVLREGCILRCSARVQYRVQFVMSEFWP